MKRGDSVLKGNNHQSNFLFSFFISRFQSFFIFRMSVEKSFMENLQRQSKEKLQKLKDKQKRLKKQHKFANILPLQFSSPKRGLPFPYLIYSFFSFQKSFPISKFERNFESIKKNQRYCKETLKRYNLKKPIRQIGSSEQVGPISIFDSKEDQQKANLQEQQQSPLH